MDEPKVGGWNQFLVRIAITDGTILLDRDVRGWSVFLRT